MPRYTVQHHYSAQRSGSDTRMFGPWEPGTEVELEEADAEWVNRDSADTLTPVDPATPDPDQDTPDADPDATSDTDADSDQDAGSDTATDDAEEAESADEPATKKVSRPRGRSRR